MNRSLQRAMFSLLVVLGGSLAWADTPGEATRLLVTDYDSATGDLAITYDPAAAGFLRRFLPRNPVESGYSIVPRGDAG